jgi:hypothetical protein
MFVAPPSHPVGRVYIQGMEMLLAPLLTFLQIVPIGPINGGNSLTLPAQRHLLRMPTQAGAAWLLALQQDGHGGRRLGFFRSDDGGHAWRYYAPIQDERAHRDTADLLAVEQDIALVYSYEGPHLNPSAEHDVYFQWWRYDGHGDWHPEPARRVFDSTDPGGGYYRAELERDAAGRLWVQAYRLEPDGRHTIVLAVSQDGGASFVEQPALDTLPARGGGRLLSLGDQMILLYDMHDADTPALYRLRRADAPLEQWSAAAIAFPEGIYHGAALSAVADGVGGMHLAYKDEHGRLFYRRFDGARFGPPQMLDDNPTANWALQPALTRVGNELVLFYNPIETPDHYGIRLRRAPVGGAFGPPIDLDERAGFIGYPAAPATWPEGSGPVPCVWGTVEASLSSGEARIVFDPSGQGGDGQLLFSDNFARTGYGLGTDWETVGLWVRTGRGKSVLDEGGHARVAGRRCADCRVEARVVGWAAHDVALFVRALDPAAAGTYDVNLSRDGMVRIRRYRGGVVTVLGEAPSGLGARDASAVLSLTVTGREPVVLTAQVNGIVRVKANDASREALVDAGHAGLWAADADAAFDDFALWAVGSGGGGTYRGDRSGAGSGGAGSARLANRRASLRGNSPAPSAPLARALHGGMAKRRGAGVWETALPTGSASTAAARPNSAQGSGSIGPRPRGAKGRPRTRSPGRGTPDRPGQCLPREARDPRGGCVSVTFARG